MLTTEASLEEASIGQGMEAGPSTRALPEVPSNSPLALYQPVRYLDQGGFGFVVLATSKAKGEMVAIKFVECT
jgi:hypothetical protein